VEYFLPATLDALGPSIDLMQLVVKPAKTRAMVVDLGCELRTASAQKIYREKCHALSTI
jgi:hypothetical protein